jgi:hypothetical protein
MTGRMLDPTWCPSQADIEYGLALGLNIAAINNMAEDMRLWAGANANRQIARKSNWSMAFKGWMRREATKQGKIANGAGNATMAAFDCVIDHAAGRAGQNGDGAKDITGNSREVGKTAGRAVATRQPAESWGLFARDRQDP